MTAQLLDGKVTSATIKDEITAQVAEFKAAAGFAPNLAVVQLGSDRAATSYVGRIPDSQAKRRQGSSWHDHTGAASGPDQPGSHRADD